MMARKKNFAFAATFSLLAVIILTFQNCSDVKFETTDELLKAGIDGELRQITVSPKFVENRPEIDVTTILDNSNSMTKIQSNVKDAVSSTTTSLKGFSGTFNLYTTTQDLSGAFSKHTSQAYSEFYKIEDGNGILKPSLSFTAADLASYKAQLDGDGKPLFNSFESWVRYRNYSPFKSLTFSQSMNRSQFSSFQDQVYGEISKVDTSGSPTEVGLCNLLRNVTDFKSNSGFHTYIIATNEDDFSTEENCLKEESRRWDRQENEVVGGAVTCTDDDPECMFKYTVSYKAPRRYIKQYRKSYVGSQKINFSLQSFNVRTKQRKLKYKTARRYVRHKKRQTSWEIKFKDKVIDGYNDGEPYYREDWRTISHSARPTAYGTCSSGTTSFTACSGSDLSYFNSAGFKTSHPNLVAGSCQVRCKNTDSGWVTNYIDGSSEPASTTISYSEVDSANVSGYTSGCKSYVAQKNSYSALGVVNAAIISCEKKASVKDHEPRIGSITNEVGTCSSAQTSCSTAELNAAKSSLGFGSYSSSLFTCTNYCSAKGFSGNLNSSSFSGRLTGSQLCSGKSAGSPESPNFTDGCNAAELSAAKSNLESQLAANGISVSLTNAQVGSCNYTCAHKNTGNKNLGGWVELATWANTSTTSVSCSDSSFSSAPADNIFGCRKYYNNGTRPADIKFDSDDGSICDGSYTLAGIMAHGDAGSVVDHGASRPLNSCSHSGGKKGGETSISYTWPAQDAEKHSLIGEDGLIQTLTDRLKAAHGNNFYVAAFINDPSREATDCKGANLEEFYGSNNSSIEYEGKKYKALAKKLGPKNMKTFSACMPDYKKAMKFVFDLIVTSAKRSYKVDLDEEAKEWIYRVKMLDSHGIVHELNDKQYRWENGLLSINEGFNMDDAELFYIDIVVPNLAVEEEEEEVKN